MKKIILVFIITHSLLHFISMNAQIRGERSDDLIKRHGVGGLYNELLDINIKKDTAKKSTVYVFIKNMYPDTIFIPSKYLVDTRNGSDFMMGHINVHACKDSVPTLEGDTVYYAHYKDCFCHRKYYYQYEITVPEFEIIKGERLIAIPPKTTIQFSFWYPFLQNAYSFLRIQGYIYGSWSRMRMPFVLNTNVVYYEER